MGQGDLPDPAENGRPLASPGTDDLLAQLAGDEIDRLLAEDAEPAAPPAADQPEPEAVLAAARQAAEEETSAPAPSPEAEDQTRQQLDDLFNALTAEPQTEPRGEAHQEASPAPATAGEAPLDPAEQTSALERQVLAAQAIEEPAAEPAEPAPVSPPPDREPRDPLWLRVLEWVNRPLEGLSEGTRHALGVVAIATLVIDLLAMLVYALLLS